ncbi:MAG: NINE protein [Saprospiraceae bacterium]|nr:NINE protein [Saprospiraceae bacterium]
MKNKNVAGVLALIVGIFGTHRFYLGQRFLGVLYFFAFWAGLGLTIEEGNPILMLLPALISLVDGIVFFAMPWEDFDRRYNKAYFKQQNARAIEERSFSVPVEEEAPPRISKFEHHKREGIRKFRSHDFAGAVADFLEAQTVRPKDPAISFNLACCYSMLEQSVPAFYYLETSLANGFDNVEKIHQHPALAFLRMQHEFAKYTRREEPLSPPPPPPPPPPTREQEVQDFFDLNVQEDVEIPEPLIKLEDLLNRGILTPEEFEAQKEKMFGYR